MSIGGRHGPRGRSGAILGAWRRLFARLLPSATSTSARKAAEPWRPGRLLLPFLGVIYFGRSVCGGNPREGVPRNGPLPTVRERRLPCQPRPAGLRGQRPPVMTLDTTIEVRPSRTYASRLRFPRAQCAERPRAGSRTRSAGSSSENSGRRPPRGTPSARQPREGRRSDGAVIVALPVVIER